MEMVGMRRSVYPEVVRKARVLLSERRRWGGEEAKREKGDVCWSVSLSIQWHIHTTSEAEEGGGHNDR
jgi:hypothetical protein